MEEGDEELVAAVRDGSERAFNVLVDRHQQAVRTFLRGITSWDDCRRHRAGDLPGRLDARRQFPRGTPARLAVLNRLAQGQGRTTKLVSPAPPRFGLSRVLGADPRHGHGGSARGPAGARHAALGAAGRRRPIVWMWTHPPRDRGGAGRPARYGEVAHPARTRPLACRVRRERHDERRRTNHHRLAARCAPAARPRVSSAGARASRAAAIPAPHPARVRGRGGGGVVSALT